MRHEQRDNGKAMAQRQNIYQRETRSILSGMRGGSSGSKAKARRVAKK